jgi:hypothetical protein
MGYNFIHQSAKGSAIRAASTAENTSRSDAGYDGQFVFYIALDPANARYHMDVPAYRYSRILYPMLARLFTGGSPQAIPYALVYINLIAICVGTLSVALWLDRKRKSPWLALMYGFYPGFFVAIRNDLTEALAFAFITTGAYLLTSARRRSTVLAGIAFTCAIMTRESTAIFPIFFGLSRVQWGRFYSIDGSQRIRTLAESCMLAVVPLVPYVLYKLFLTHWLQNDGVPSVLYPTLVPFQGIYHYYPWNYDHEEQIRSVVLPAIICALTSIWVIARVKWSVEVLLLLANTLIFVILLNPLSFTGIDDSIRIATGVVLAAIYALPVIDKALAGRRGWLWLCCALWLPLTLFWLVLPVINALIPGIAHA